MELRVCITKYCNYKCTYCSKDGEGIYSEFSNLTCEEILERITKLKEMGIDSVRLTGGEPFLREDILEILEGIYNKCNIRNISMVTNGSIIDKNILISIYEKRFLKYISVSLDTLDDKEYYNITSGGDLSSVLENIDLLKKIGMNVRINMVVTKENARQILKIWEYCKQKELDLKLLDIYNDKNKFYDLSKITDEMKYRGFKYEEEYISSYLGTPMEVFKVGKSKMIIKNGKKGSTYSNEICRKCKKYPCMLGMTGPIMTHDGLIKCCNFAREWGIYKIKELDDIKRVYDNIFRRGAQNEENPRKVCERI